MDVVGHDDVCKDQKSGGLPSFVECFADYLFHFVGPKYREPIVRDRRQVINGRGAGDLIHYVAILGERKIGSHELLLIFLKGGVAAEF